MSVSYQNQETEIPAETENVKRATYAVPYYSYILIACIIAVSAVQILTNLDESIIAAGFVKPAFRQGQYWRILTGAALHGGLLHLGFNAYALYVLGKLIETLSNRAHLAIAFLLSIIGGNLLSLAFLPEGIAVGASGGIIGFLGYLAVYGYRRRELLSNAFLKSMLLNIGFIAIYGIMLYQIIDNFAHLGGLLAGAIYGFLQIPSDLHKDPRETGNAANVLALVSIGIFIAISLFSILLILQTV